MKKAIPIIGIPVLNRADLLERLIRSIDFPVEILMIINNGDDAGVVALLPEIKFINPMIRNVQVRKPEKNMGCAGSWNKVFSDYPDLPWWMITANDNVFATPGTLEKIYNHAEANHTTHAMFFMYGYGMFIMTQKGLKEVGTFDENFYPAYCEDSDHWWRVRASRAVTSSIPGVESDKDILHGIKTEDYPGGSHTINSDKHYQQANGQTYTMNADYYKRKWGGGGGEEVFGHPFNNPDNPLNWWKLEPERRAQMEEIWRRK